MRLNKYKLLKTPCPKRMLPLLFFIFSLYPISILAWDSDVVHPILSKSSMMSFMLNNSQYLKDNLGINNGLEEVFAGQELFKWIRDGSIGEDKLPRFLNHFHNPIYPIGSWGDAGLDDIWFRGYSSIIWAQANGTQANSAGGDWSWIRTRREYFESLRSTDPIKREEFFSNALLGLGHQIHLIQDMAVPAHVRNDAHPLSYNEGGAPIIEKWARENNTTIKNIANTVIEEVDVPLTQETKFNDVILSPIARLSDSDQYDGLNPSMSTAIGLAEYTNANFFSDDTIFTENADTKDPHGFPYPRATSTNLQSYIDKNELPANIIAKDGVEDIGFWIKKNTDGEEIAHLVKPIYFTYDLSPETHPALYHRLFYLDEACHQDYVEKLIPKAVGYSTALLDYFFRGQLSVSAIPTFAENTLKDIKLNVQNTTETQEVISEGNFYLLIQYKKEDADIFVRADYAHPSGELAYQDSKEILFQFTTVDPIYVEEWEDVTLTLAYRGKLGNEIDAVVGKVFKPEVTDLFVENWDNGIDKDKWQNTGDDDDDSTQTAIEGHLIMESTQSSNHNGVSRINSLVKDFTTNGSDGILITQTTYFQFNIPIMESFFGDHPEWANHALLLHFNDGTVIEYSGDGRLFNWTSSDRLIPYEFDPAERIIDNIHARFEIGGHPIPDPLYLKSIQFMQLVSFDTLIDYYFYMEVDNIRFFDTQWEE